MWIQAISPISTMSTMYQASRLEFGVVLANAGGGTFLHLRPSAKGSSAATCSVFCRCPEGAV